MFLLMKATTEIHHRLEGTEGKTEDSGKARWGSSFAGVITQIILLDVVFSLDSVITAVGVAEDVPVMVIAIVIAVGAMMLLRDGLLGAGGDAEPEGQKEGRDPCGAAHALSSGRSARIRGRLTAAGRAPPAIPEPPNPCQRARGLTTPPHIATQPILIPFKPAREMFGTSSREEMGRASRARSRRLRASRYLPSSSALDAALPRCLIRSSVLIPFPLSLGAYAKGACPVSARSGCCNMMQQELCHFRWRTVPARPSRFAMRIRPR